MASIRKRGKRWQAQVRVRGVAKSRTFETKAEAQKWAFAEERTATQSVAGLTVGDAFARYADEVSPSKKGARNERSRLSALSSDPLAAIPLDRLRHGDLAAFRDRRLQVNKSSSVNRDLNLVSAVFTRCVREWHWLDENPCRKLDRPRNPPPRDRRITDDEIELVLSALSEGERNREVGIMFLLALETAMRLSELANLQWEHVHPKYVVLLDTKNGDRRNVPLSSRARELLSGGGEGEVFKVSAASASTLFRKAVKRTGIQNLRFHDTRHEALTRLARKLDVLDLARMIGHRNTASLMIYYNARPEEIADRLG